MHFITSVLESYDISFLALMKIVAPTSKRWQVFDVFLCSYRQWSLIEVLFILQLHNTVCTP